jgi:hypothetical protein
VHVRKGFQRTNRKLPSQLERCPFSFAREFSDCFLRTALFADPLIDLSAPGDSDESNGLQFGADENTANLLSSAASQYKANASAHCSGGPGSSPWNWFEA